MKRWLRKASITGFEVNEFDAKTGITCPRKDCNQKIVYNGNYFCSCGWAAECDKPSCKESRIFNESLIEGLKKLRPELFNRVRG